MEVFDCVLRSSRDTEEWRGEKLVVRHILTLTLDPNISCAHNCRSIPDLLCTFAVFSLGKNALSPGKIVIIGQKKTCFVKI